MAVFGLDFKKKAKPSGAFSFDTLILTGRSKHRTMSNARLVGTAASLFFGGIMCYTAMHYLPAYVNKTTILSYTNADTSAARLNSTSPVKSVIQPYLELFDLKRTYLRPGQRIQVQYDIPKNAKLNLTIKRCARNVLFEVYKCQVVGERKVTVSNKTIGTQEFRFQEGGFYLFDDEIVRTASKKTDYQVIWRRG